MRRVGRRKGERGGATILLVACLGLLMLLGASLGVVAAMVAAHRRAQAAADLASLAAARALQDGGDACGRAAELAVANGARLGGCEIRGSDVLVTVTVTGPRWLGQTADLSARARAGPSGPSTSVGPVGPVGPVSRRAGR